MINRKLVRHLSVIAVVSSVVIYNFQNCGRPDDISGLSTLDNFAAASSLRTNQCSGNPQSAIVARGMGQRVAMLGDAALFADAPTIELITNAISAVPLPIQQTYLRLGGGIIAADDASTICNAAAPGTNSEVAGCVVFSPRNEQRAQVLNIVVTADLAEINHSLSYLMGSFVAQTIPKLFPSQASAITTIREQIAEAYLLDLAKSRTFDFASIEPFVGASDVQAIRDAASSNNMLGILSRLSFSRGGNVDSATKQRRRDQLADMIYINAFDSFNCNSWAQYDEGLLQAVASGQAQARRLAEVANSRAIMKALFPNTFQAYERGGLQVEKIVGGIGGQSGFNLDAISSSPLEPEPEFANAIAEASAANNGKFSLARNTNIETPWQAFWGSISDNTGYSRYLAAVRNAGSNMSGKSIIGDTLSTVGSVTRDGYVENVYKPVAEQTQRDFDFAQRNGASNPAYDAVAISMGRYIGTTQIAEGGVGYGINEDRVLNVEERVVRVADGTGKVASNLALVGGLLPNARNVALRNPLASRAPYAGVADDVTNAAVTNSGLSPKYAERAKGAFGPGAELKTAGNNQTIFIYSDKPGAASSRWAVTRPTANPQGSLALPKSNSAKYVTEMRLKPGTKYLEGRAASMVGAGDKFTSGAIGGGKQILIIADDASKVMSAPAIPQQLGRAVGGAAVVNGTNAVNTAPKLHEPSH